MYVLNSEISIKSSYVLNSFILRLLKYSNFVKGCKVKLNEPQNKYQL